MWILIIVLGVGQGVSSSSVEFKTRKQCQKTADTIAESVSDRFVVYTFCAQK